MADQFPPPPGDQGWVPPPPNYGGYPPPGPPFATQPSGMKPDAYLVQSILVALFCCQTLGIVAIVFSVMSGSAWNRGDVAGANDHAANARKFVKWSLISGLVVVVLYLLIAVIAVLGSSSTPG